MTTNLAPFKSGDRVWWPAIAEKATVETCTFSLMAGWWVTGVADSGRRMRTSAGNLKPLRENNPPARLTWTKPRLIAHLGEIIAPAEASL